MITALASYRFFVAALLCVGLLLAWLLTRQRQHRIEADVHRLREALAAAREAGTLTLPAQASLAPPLGAMARELQDLLDATQQEAEGSLEALVANRLLAREMKRLRALMDALHEGIVAVDTADKVIFANKGMAPFLTVTPAEAPGRNVAECLKPREVLALFNGKSEDAAPHGIRSLELAPENEHGTEHVAVSQSHAFVGNGEPVGELLVFRDISKLKNMQRLQAQFVDSVAHELRTPLTSIRAYVEMLIDNEAQDPQMQYDFYNVIYEETYRLSALIDNLLNISMMEGGAVKLDITPTRLKRLLEEAIDVIRPQCEKKNIELVVDLPDRLPTLNVDKRLFNVALMNVLGNAAKYTPEGGTVTITTSSHEEELHISVRDTGMGIDEKDLPRIFDKFFRAASAEEIQGSGVGLATARQIVQLHGGDISVSSTVGVGSHFLIGFPRTLINTSIGD